MRHKHSNRILGRTAPKRAALLRGLTHDLLTHGAVTTTTAKAQELRKHIEPLITKARGTGALHVDRQLRSAVTHATDVAMLGAVAKAHAKRAGGYTRLTAIPAKRHDNASMCTIEIIDFDKAA